MRRYLTLIDFQRKDCNFCACSVVKRTLTWCPYAGKVWMKNRISCLRNSSFSRIETWQKTYCVNGLTRHLPCRKVMDEASRILYIILVKALDYSELVPITVCVWVVCLFFSCGTKGGLAGRAGPLENANFIPSTMLIHIWLLQGEIMKNFLVTDQKFLSCLIEGV